MTKAKTKKQHLKLYNEVSEENYKEPLNKRQRESILTVKELKRLLEEVEDENQPVVIETFTDAHTLMSSPLYGMGIGGECSSESEKECAYVSLYTYTENDKKGFDTWKDEEELCEWSDHVLREAS